MITSETFRHFDKEVSILSSPIHSLITRAALNCLPHAAREFYRDESECLIAAYCGLPDINWEWYGTFLGDANNPADVRLPDLRREWNCTDYCERDAIKDVERKQFRLHEPPDTIEAVGYFADRALREFHAGNYLDGVRRLGVAMHYLQDSGSPSHAACVHGEYHSPMETLPDPWKILHIAYEPKILTNFAQRASELVTSSLGKSEKIHNACKADDLTDVFPDILDCAHECVHASADMLYTVWNLAEEDVKQKYPDIPLDTNLLANPSFRNDTKYDTEVPKGWVWCWYDLSDRNGKISWDMENGLTEHRSIRIENSPPAGIECRIPWTNLLHVSHGQVFEARCSAKLKQATGNSYIVLYLYDHCLRKINAFRSESISGNTNWQKMSIIATIPDDACLLRLAMRSDNNKGTAWFDNVSLKRME